MKIVQYFEVLADRSYFNLPKELYHSKEGLINIQTIDVNDCFKWCLVRYLHPVDYHPARIRRIDKHLEGPSGL